MNSRDQNIVTRDDIEDINEDPKGKSNTTLNEIISIIAIFLLVGIIIYLFNHFSKKDKYSYTDEKGENHEVSINFSERDLHEVYEELSEIPLEI